MKPQEAEQLRNKVISNNVKKTGLRGKINAKCAECIYDPINGGGSWRQQVRDCTSPECPLFSVRPLSTNGSDNE